jgi:hypothetical protein
MATGPQLRLRYVEQFLNDYVFSAANKTFDVLRITGPLTIREWLFRVQGLEAADIDPWTRAGPGPLALTNSQVVFDEETSVAELRFHRPAVLDRVQDRLASAFGLWRPPR